MILQLRLPLKSSSFFGTECFAVCFIGLSENSLKAICIWLGFPAAAAAAAARSLQSCLTLCCPIDGSPPGSAVPGILQARTLEWVAISFSNAWKWKVNVKSLSRVQLFATPWTAAHWALLPMGFSKQEYWSGLPLPSLWDSLVAQKRICLQGKRPGFDSWVRKIPCHLRFYFY